MNDQQLNNLVTTGMQAIRILCEHPRTTNPDGTSTIVLGSEFKDKFYNDLYDASMAIKEVTELSNLLEIRVLEMQTEEAIRRLNHLRGNHE